MRAKKKSNNNKRAKNSLGNQRFKRQGETFIDIGEIGDNVPHVIFMNERIRW